MTTYDAGTARATYAVDFSTFNREADAILRKWREIGDAQRAAQRGAPSGGGGGGGAGRGGGGNTAAAAARAEREALALARAQATNAKEAGNLAEAIDILQRALANANPNTVAAAQTQRQLARALRESAEGANAASSNLQTLPRSFSGLSGQAAQLASQLGVAFGASQIAAFTGEAIRAANQLEDVQQSLRVVAGDQATYNEALRAAQDAQRLFGGSLAENIGDLQGFILTARTANVSLDELVLVSRQLALLDPGQGLRGASIALREFLSGNITSLAQRFELPRTVLRTLGDETATTSDKLEALSTFLGEAGITAESINGRLNNTSQAYRDLGIAAEQATVKIGGIAARGLEPATRGLTFLTNGVNGLIDRLSGVTPQVDGFNAAIIAGTGNYQEYRAAAEQARDATNGGGEASERLARALNGIAPGLGDIVNASANAAVGIRVLTEEEYNAAGGAEVAARAISEATNQYSQFYGAAQDAAGAGADAASALNLGELAADAAEKALSAAARAAFEKANADASLEEQARAAAAELLNAGQAGEVAAGQLAASASPLDVLIARYYDLAVAAREARAAQQNNVPPSSRPGFGGTAPADVARSEQIAKNSQEFVKANADAADQLAIVRSQLKAVEVGTEEYYRLRNEEKRITDQIAAERERAATRTTRAATKAANAEAREAERAREAAARELERRQEEIARAYERIEDETREHYRDLRRQAEDFVTDDVRATEDYQKERQRLLAEGRIFEAEQLRQEFETERKRAREDRDREAQRTREDFAENVNEIAEGANLGAVRGLDGVPAGAPVAVAVPATLPTLPAQQAAAAGLPGAPVALDGRLVIDFAPITLLLDGEAVAQAVYPSTEIGIAEAIARGRISIEPGVGPGQYFGVGGPRP